MQVHTVQASACTVVAWPIKVHSLTEYVPGESRTLPEMKERIGSRWAVAEEEESALGPPPMVCGLVRGGLRGPGVGFELSLSCELTDWLLLLQEKLSGGEAIVARRMVLLW